MPSIGPASIPSAHYQAVAEKDSAVFSITLDLNALETTIAEIDQAIRFESAEDRPTDGTISAAKCMIRAAGPFLISATEVESFEGKLFVHWVMGAKRVTLITDSDPAERTFRLYKRTSSSLSELIPNPSPSDLHDAIYWTLGMC